MKTIQHVETDQKCFHCGTTCSEIFSSDDKSFCCFGCKTVYEILKENDLCTYYELAPVPGVRQEINDRYNFLEEPSVANELLSFRSEKFAKVEFQVPSVHCISCIWLLENLQRLEDGIIRSEVNFPAKRVSIFFDPGKTSIRNCAEVLARIGYAPKITLASREEKKSNIETNSLLLKLAVAGFAFGNIMLLSFPEYLGIDTGDRVLAGLFSFLNIVISIPVLVYSSSDYLRSAWKSLERKQINLDVPLAIGILALFFRSVTDILSGYGPGYLDSFAGLIFFLLIGRWFQTKTFENLSFDRDYKSFFPLSVIKETTSGTVQSLVYELVPGDVITVRNNEVIPCDSVLLDPLAIADYSFVTGETAPVSMKAGTLVYAGGRLIGKPVRLRVEKKIEQGHLTSLWNSSIFKKPDEARFRRFVDQTARRFTWIILGITIIAASYWGFADPSRVWIIVTSILIVACPCALALSAPFTFGNMLRVFGQNGFYLKNADVLERMSQVDAIVFDKTGTVTIGSGGKVSVHGHLSEAELSAVRSVTAASTHPLSVRIHDFLKELGSEQMPVASMHELNGKGIIAHVGNFHVRIGSPSWITPGSEMSYPGSAVYIEINSVFRGYFLIQSGERPGIRGLLQSLDKKIIALLSGDNDHDAGFMKKIFPATAQLLFKQSPADKMNYISGHPDKKIMMVGDGLNDAGALQQSYVGVAVSDNHGVFTPACDAILIGTKVPELDTFLQLSKSASLIVKMCFVISFLYNVVGLTFAVTGNLTPLFAAILMPLSSITVVVFTSLAVRFVAYLKKH
jgi:Cu+-exporting ATPase